MKKLVIMTVAWCVLALTLSTAAFAAPGSGVVLPLDHDRTTQIAPGTTATPVGTGQAVLPRNGAIPTARPVPPMPVVSALSAYNGAPGTQITITGTNFGDQKKSSIVWFNGVRAKFNSWSDTTIVFTVPADVGSGYVGIENEIGCSNGLYFVPFEAPVLTSVSANVAAVGSVLTITGSNFDVTPGAVSFNGVNGEVQTWTNTQITVKVPAGATAGYIGVVQHELTSNGWLFTPYYQPVVTSLSGQYALVGDQVTITGADFGDAACEVVLGGQRYAADSWSDTSITFTVDQGALSGYCGVVRDGVVSNGVYLFVAPRIDAASSWWAAPGTQVTVTGRGFGNADGETFVLLFGGTRIAADTWSDTSVTFTLPQDAVSGYIGFTDAQSASTSNGYWLLVIDQATISSVSSPDVATGSVFSIQGVGFGPVGFGELLLNGVPLDVVSWTDTEIVAVAPATPTYGYLSVRKSGVDSNGMLLNVYDPAIVAATNTPIVLIPGTDSAIERPSVGSR